MKQWKLIICAVAFGQFSGGCAEHNISDGGGDNSDEAPKSAFEIACTATGGIYESNKCKCGDIFCDEGDVCNSSSKKCPEKSLPEICATDSVLCNNSMLFKCNADNRFVEEKSCDYGCKTDHSACAECLTDKCEDAGIITKCVGGVYQFPSYCKSGSCKNDTACYHECEEGDKICQDGKIKECKQEEYFEVERCEYGCDKNNVNTCATGCEDNDQICTDGMLKICSGGKYGTPISCPNGYSCQSETACGMCKNDQVYCVNDESGIGYLRTCRNGQLIAGGFVCNDNHSCNSDADFCGVCKNGTRRCVNDPDTKIGHIEICENGQFVPENSECPGSFSCKSNTMCGDCLNDTQTCTNDENQLGIEHVCTNGTLIHRSCDGNNSCSQDKCGECKNGYKQCSGIKAFCVNCFDWCENGRLQREQCSILTNRARPYCKPDAPECTATQN